MRDANFRMFKFSHVEGAFEKYENLHHSKISRYTVYNELNCIACIPLDFIDGRSDAAAAQGEPKTRT